MDREEALRRAHAMGLGIAVDSFPEDVVAAAATAASIEAALPRDIDPRAEPAHAFRLTRVAGGAS